MKKTFLLAVLFSLTLFILLAGPVMAWKIGDPLVPCGDTRACELKDFFTMLANVYSFIVLEIATPLAVIALTIGGIFMMVSAGNPNTFAKGKEIMKWAIIGLVLTFGSYLIISFILEAVGFTKNWQNPI